MDSNLNFFALITLLSFTALAIIAINTLNNFNKFINNSNSLFSKIQNDIDILRDKSVDALDSVQDMKKELINISAEIKELKEKSTQTLENTDEALKDFRILSTSLNNTVLKVNESIEPYRDLVSKVYETIEPPISQTTNIINAAGKALKVVLSRFGNR